MSAAKPTSTSCSALTYPHTLSYMFALVEDLSFRDGCGACTWAIYQGACTHMGNISTCSKQSVGLRVHRVTRRMVMLAPLRESSNFLATGTISVNSDCKRIGSIRDIVCLFLWGGCCKYLARAPSTNPRTSYREQQHPCLWVNISVPLHGGSIYHTNQPPSFSTSDPEAHSRVFSFRL